jgi:hypothetical protein
MSRPNPPVGPYGSQWPSANDNPDSSNLNGFNQRLIDASAIQHESELVPSFLEIVAELATGNGDGRGRAPKLLARLAICMDGDPSVRDMAATQLIALDSIEGRIEHVSSDAYEAFAERFLDPGDRNPIWISQVPPKLFPLIKAGAPKKGSDAIVSAIDLALELYGQAIVG